MEKSKPSVFEVSVKGLKYPELFKKQAGKVANEISNKIGRGIETKINLVPLSGRRNQYRLTISAEVGGEPLLVCRRGRRPHSLLRQGKRVILAMAKEHQTKKMKKNRRKPHRWALHSFDFIT